MKIQELYEKWVPALGKPETKYIKPELFYVQPMDSDCRPGTFGCDAGSHLGTLDSAKVFATNLKQYSKQRFKIVDPNGKVLDIV